MNPYILGGGVAAAAPSTFCKDNNSTQSTDGTLCEDFDNPSSNDCYTGASDDNCYLTWTIFATPVDFTGTNIGGTGSVNSCDLNGTGNTTDTVIYYGFTPTSGATYWLYAKIKPSFTLVATAELPIIVLKGNGDATTLGTVSIINTAGSYYLGATAFGGTSVYTTGTITSGETYNLWVMADPGSSNTTKIHAAFSTGTTRPNDGDAGYAKSENGQSDYALDSIRVWGQHSSANATMDTIVDNIFVGAANTAITGIP